MLPRTKNRQTGSATQLVYDVADVVWKIGLCESQLKNKNLWQKIPKQVLSLVRTGRSKHSEILMTQSSTKFFASDIRDIASLAIMAKPAMFSYKIALLSSAEVFDDYSDILKAQAAAQMERRQESRNISTAAEAVRVQTEKNSL